MARRILGHCVGGSRIDYASFVSHSHIHALLKLDIVRYPFLNDSFILTHFTKLLFLSYHIELIIRVVLL